jgi:cbb3-type cytochrome oxidase subunit 3
LSWISRFYLLGNQPVTYLPLSDYYFWGLLYSIIYILVGYVLALYAPKRKTKFAIEVAKLSQAH